MVRRLEPGSSTGWRRSARTMPDLPVIQAYGTADGSPQVGSTAAPAVQQDAASLLLAADRRGHVRRLARHRRLGAAIPWCRSPPRPSRLRRHRAPMERAATRPAGVGRAAGPHARLIRVFVVGLRQGVLLGCASPPVAGEGDGPAGEAALNDRVAAQCADYAGLAGDPGVRDVGRVTAGGIDRGFCRTTGRRRPAARRPSRPRPPAGTAPATVRGPYDAVALLLADRRGHLRRLARHR